jgi:hypothetical protein
MNKDTGGPAFPSEHGNIPEDVGQFGRANGCSLRDYFAAKAMGVKFERSGGSMTLPEMAEICYQMADAMLAERSKP